MALQNKFPKDRYYMYLDVNVGSCDEEDREQGIALFLEHLSTHQVGSEKADLEK